MNTETLLKEIAERHIKLYFQNVYGNEMKADVDSFSYDLSRLISYWKNSLSNPSSDAEDNISKYYETLCKSDKSKLTRRYRQKVTKCLQLKIFKDNL